MMPTATSLNHDPKATELVQALFAAATAAVLHAVPPDCHAGAAAMLQNGAKIEVVVSLPSGAVSMWLETEDRRVELARVIQSVMGTA